MCNITVLLVLPWTAQRRNGTLLQKEKDNRAKERSHFKVHAAGRSGDIKIKCLNTTGVPALLLVQSLSQRRAIIDFSVHATFDRNLRDQSHLFWTSVFVTGGRSTLPTNLGPWPAGGLLRSATGFWKVSTNGDSTLRHPRRAEGPVH